MNYLFINLTKKSGTLKVASCRIKVHSVDFVSSAASKFGANPQPRQVATATSQQGIPTGSSVSQQTHTCSYYPSTVPQSFTPPTTMITPPTIYGPIPIQQFSTPAFIPVSAPAPAPAPAPVAASAPSFPYPLQTNKTNDQSYCNQFTQDKTPAGYVQTPLYYQPTSLPEPFSSSSFATPYSTQSDIEKS
ncbi:uncharacterized protein MONOS_10964 [Monocercomonoides exilis]|uniref:uncharacterized protein n=1 Tax=Monocercomonoides exilis TaxID=2049356 RepID=UPI00355A1051|nr:hypothetical protein MONOS_10964 [Monocercomonoides exilis]|eukprot:MONOS_10964.1-p1 / transcript=MONOS_10964.1 / gene=MONOS_10964 / organism=Monocercomonoides_exilis_PA203 / gene_product=unspecified product / transcript_product=unspecified product / location=Mono_scaffold00522:31766-32526(+) / protein_length=189 / sequence_SO=supercontig / SO=protein_coding / is_pseudo=false